MIVCSCNALSSNTIRSTVAPDGSGPVTAGDVYDCLGCSPDCGRCAREIRAIIAEARTVCASQCHSCASHDIECAVHIRVDTMLDGVAAANDRAAA